MFKIIIFLVKSETPEYWIGSEADSIHEACRIRFLI
jgi:hypothetical protein